jgi:hypothetical protein
VTRKIGKNAFGKYDISSGTRSSSLVQFGKLLNIFRQRAKKVVTLSSDTVILVITNHDLRRTTHNVTGSEIVTGPTGQPDFEG